MNLRNTALVALLIVTGTSRTTISQSERQIPTLEPYTPVERRIAGGQTHEYQIRLGIRQYLQAVVEQRGIDVVVTLIGPDGRTIREVDSPNGTQGPEPLAIIAAAEGSYVIRIAALEHDAPAGSYEVRVEELRTSTEKDLVRISADEALADAGTLRSEGTATALRRALKLFEDALKFLRAIHDQSREAVALNEMGLILADLGENRKAIEVYEEALPLWRTVENRAGEMSTMNNLAGVYQELGENEKALQYYQQVLPFWRSIADQQGEAQCLNNIGTVYSSLGEKRKALEYYQLALPLRRAVNDHAGEAATLNNIGVVYNAIGENQRALEHYQRALPIWRLAKKLASEAATLNNIGTVYRDLGEFQKALEFHLEAIPRCIAAGDRAGEAQSLHNIGLVFSTLGEKQRALDYYQQALPKWRAGGNRVREASTLNNMGSVYWSLEDRQKALEFHQRALQIQRALGIRPSEANSLNNIGAVYSDLGDTQKALEYYQEALAIRRAVGDRSGEAMTLNNIGVVCSNLRETQKAFEHYHQALSLAQEINDSATQLKIYESMAHEELRSGNYEGALKAIQSAKIVAESLRSRVTDPDLRSSYMASTGDLYHTHAAILLSLHRQNPAVGYDRQALESLERGRARSLLEMLREARADIRRDVDPTLLETEVVAGRQIDAKSDRLIRLLGGKHTEEQVAASKKEISDLETEYLRVQASIRAASPRYAALTQPGPLTVQQIQEQVLDRDTVLLEYSLGKERSFLFALTSNSLQSFELPSRQEIEKTARLLYDILTIRNRRIPGESDGDRRERIERAEYGYQDAARKLASLVVAPAGPFLSGKRLAVVADGILQYIPFEALPDPGSKTFRALVAAHEVVYLPSASVLAQVRSDSARRRPAARELAVLADPVFDSSDTRIVQRPAATRVSDIAMERAALDAGVFTGELRLPRLVFTRQEAESIYALSAKDQSFKALDFEANRERVLSQVLSQYRMVHFATHGLLDAQRPALSGLVLSLVDERGQPREGFLKLTDIYNLDLPAELVVLSACQTGLGKEVRGEGLIGLTRGFFYAGARRVVASLWKVDDVATAELMERFYKGMLVGRLRPAEALRQAQLALSKHRLWTSPYYWAGFTLQGEWR